MARRQPRPRLVRARGPGRGRPAHPRPELLRHLSLAVALASGARKARPRDRGRAFLCAGPGLIGCGKRRGEQMARAWHLKSRPQGLPTDDNFALKDVDLPPMGDGMVRVRNHWLSVDPYMRGRMNDVKSYVPPFQIDAPMEGGAVGEVVESQAEASRPATPCCTWPAGATRRCCRRTALNKLPDPRRRAAGLPRQSRADRRHGLFRPARSRLGQARRHRLRLGRGGRGRLGGGADRQGQGHDGHRLGRRAGQMRLRPLARRRRGHRLQGRAGAQGPRRRRARRASTSISTMSAATISTPPSRWPARMPASPSAA